MYPFCDGEEFGLGGEKGTSHSVSDDGPWSSLNRPLVMDASANKTDLYCIVHRKQRNNESR